MSAADRQAFLPTFGPNTAKKRAAAAASGAVALSLLLDFIPGADSLVHVGCGSGEWLVEAQRLGIADALGIEGPWAAQDALAVERSRIVRVDYSVPFVVDR